MNKPMHSGTRSKSAFEYFIKLLRNPLLFSHYYCLLRCFFFSIRFVYCSLVVSVKARVFPAKYGLIPSKTLMRILGGAFFENIRHSTKSFRQSIVALVLRFMWRFCRAFIFNNNRWLMCTCVQHQSERGWRR